MKYILIAIIFLLTGLPHTMAEQDTTTISIEEDVLQKNSKRPYGLYIFNDQLKEIYPFAKTTYVGRKIAKHMDEIEKFYSTKDGYLILGRQFNPSQEDLEAILAYAGKGNKIMICASMFNDLAKYAFKVSTVLDNGVQNTLAITHPDLVTVPITSEHLYVDKNYFDDYTNEATVIGKNADGSANFLRIKKGDGYIYLHLYPEIFANIFLIENRNYEYTGAALSVFPKTIPKLYIRLAQKSDTDLGGNNAPRKPRDIFELIKESPNLMMVFWVTLGIIAISIAFGAKYAQRITPIIPPTTNKSLELAKTIGDLYYFNKNNTDLAQKKILYWQEYVRTKLLIPTSKMEKSFWDLVSKKSGADPSTVKGIETAIIRLRSNKKFTDQQLIQLSNNIDKFYKS